MSASASTNTSPVAKQGSPPPLEASQDASGTSAADAAPLPPFLAAQRCLDEPAEPEQTPNAQADATSTPPSPAGVWEFQKEQRRKAKETKSKHDIGFQRPTMDQLKPILELLATGKPTGGELFDAYEPLRDDSNRAVVGYVRIPTGRHTNAIDESKALKTILFDNHQNGATQSLTDLVQIRTDLANQQLILRMASFESIDRITGTAFKLPVRDGFQTFTAESSHAMDGFYIDILDFVHDRAAERHLWLLWPHGALHRSQEGKCHRVYGKGWFNHRKQIQRTDLDVAAKEKRIVKPTPGTPSQSQPSRSTGENKRQRLDNPPIPSHWRRVTRGAKDNTPSAPRPLQSPNIFDVLRQHVVVTPLHISSEDGTRTMIAPQILAAPDAPLSVPEDAFIGGSKVDTTRAVRVEIPLEDLLAEFAELDRTTEAAEQTFSEDCQTAQDRSTLDLPRFIMDGEADWLQTELEANPINFGRQLCALASDQPTLFPHFIRLRLMCRWFRATRGSYTPFYKLYQNVFGHKFSLDNLQEDLEEIVRFSKLTDYSHEIDGDECCVTALDAEAILTLGEVVLATTAPLFYNNDAALCAITNGPIFSIPTRGGHRFLASGNIKELLTSSSISTYVWELVRKLLDTAAAAAQTESQNEMEGAPGVTMEDSPTSSILSGWSRDMDAMISLDLHDKLSIEATNQTAFDATVRRLCHIDLTSPWSNSDAEPRG
ncbi:unnamed protein product [Aphanomyces euteiches]